MIPVEAVRSRFVPEVHSLVRNLLPDARLRGGWYTCRVPWRADRQPSLAVSQRTARWRDWGTGDSGTFFDLVMKLDGCDFATAVKTLAGLLWITDDDVTRPAPRKRPRCEDCKWMWQRFIDRRYCLKSLIDEEPVTTQTARVNEAMCGKAGRWHEEQSQNAGK